jgi:hypothetical protein
MIEAAAVREWSVERLSLQHYSHKGSTELHDSLPLEVSHVQLEWGDRIRSSRGEGRTVK